jgi:hypothetical protein
MSRVTISWKLITPSSEKSSGAIAKVYADCFTFLYVCCQRETLLSMGGDGVGLRTPVAQEYDN